MREFTTTAFVARPSQVLDAASQGGATLTRHGQRKFVVIPVAEYRMLARAREILEREAANLPVLSLEAQG